MRSTMLEPEKKGAGLLDTLSHIFPGGNEQGRLGWGKPQQTERGSCCKTAAFRRGGQLTKVTGKWLKRLWLLPISPLFGVSCLFG